MSPEQMDNKDKATLLAHFYRGEVGRIMTWRQRLDLTTNWAIATATGVITFAFGQADINHNVFFFANLLVLLLLFIEARRFQFYDAFRARVRILEAHLLAPILSPRPVLQGDWRVLLAGDLLSPSIKMPLTEALARRLSRVYVWVFLILALSWAFVFHRTRRTDFSFSSAYDHFVGHQPLPGLLYTALVLLFYTSLLALTAYGVCCSRSGEFSRNEKNPDLWKI